MEQKSIGVAFQGQKLGRDGILSLIQVCVCCNIISGISWKTPHLILFFIWGICFYTCTIMAHRTVYEYTLESMIVWDPSFKFRMKNALKFSQNVCSFILSLVFSFYSKTSLACHWFCKQAKLLFLVTKMTSLLMVWTFNLGSNRKHNEQS